MARKLLIIQNQIPAYRVPFFEELGKRYDLTVLFFGKDPGATAFKTIKFEGRIYKIRPFYYTPGIYSIARNYDCVIIMFDLWWINLAVLPFLLNSRRTTSILWGHGMGRTNGFKLAAYLRRVIATKAQAIVFYTDETKTIFQHRTGISTDKCFVANNTILVKKPEGPAAGSERSSFLYLGRIQARKRLHELLRAYALLSSRVREKYSLLIVGSGDNAVITELRQLAVSLDVADTVAFEPGTFDEDRIAQYYSRAVAYVSPGTVGLGVVQSFAYGVPVVTPRDIPHGPEFTYCNDANSYLYSVGDSDHTAVQQLKEALQLVASDPVTWQYKAAMADVTYNNECTMERMVEGFAQAIEYCRTAK